MAKGDKSPQKKAASKRGATAVKLPPEERFEVPTTDAEREWMVRQCGGLVIASSKAPSLHKKDWRIERCAGARFANLSTEEAEDLDVPSTAADKEWMIRQCGGLLVPKASAPPEDRFKLPSSVKDKEWIIRQCGTTAARKNLYELSYPLLDKATRERHGLRLTLPYYPQDPMVAEAYEALRPERMPKARPPLSVGWEPGFGDGPTSARLAVVDYCGDTGTLTEPAVWVPQLWAFTDPCGTPIPAAAPHSSYFHQVNTWFTVQSILDFFEEPWALGRPVPWAFPGHRLILVPHAGWGANAYYDRHSKSLQFHCFGTPSEPGYTCLSHDIIAHETGHAVLDGVRPLYLEHSSHQTAAFHEFVGDLTAVLTAVRNKVPRAILADMEREGPGALDRETFISGLANQFGKYLDGRGYLRSARSNRKMSDLGPGDSSYDCSQVLTGAMYDILHRIALKHLETEPGAQNKPSYSQALWWAIDRVRRIAIQPLDHLPPADIQFVDYARAVLRCYDLASRRDSQGYGELMREVFHERGLCTRPWEKCKEGGPCQLDSEPPPSRNELVLRRDIDEISLSRTAAYYFLDDNRGRLGIPRNRDIEVAERYWTRKWDVGRRRLPRELVIEYVWREPVELDLPRHGSLRGHKASLICGGTLVFDERGNPISWARKRKRNDWGDLRSELLREHVAGLVESGAVALVEGGEGGLAMGPGPPVVARQTARGLSFEGAPHLRDRQSNVESDPSTMEVKETFEDRYGGEPWTTSF